MPLYNRVNKEELKRQIQSSAQKRTTLSFYKYHPIDNPEEFRNELFRKFQSLDILGRIYVAQEGINAQLSVPSDKMDRFREELYSIGFLDGVRLNVAIDDDGKSFYVLKIKVRQKIVADGITAPLDLQNGGEHIDAVKFNTLASSEDTVIVDMRNHYESEVGHFENAICPDVETFRESIEVVEELLEKHREKDIVMYCTGGIRCEKATAYFKTKGYNKLYQLDGGIIEYARQVKKLGLDNQFIGKNFVFDERLGERISNEIIARCHQCGAPCDTHTNCKNEACHLLFIQCPECAKSYDQCCSDKCSSYLQLPKEEQESLRGKIEFNGTKFGKGRYKAHHQHDVLEVK